MLLKKTYIFYLPSKTENSTISIIEVMCFNSRIIAYKTGLIPEMDLFSSKSSFLIFKSTFDLKSSLSKMMVIYNTSSINKKHHNIKKYQSRFDRKLDNILKIMFKDN